MNDNELIELILQGDREKFGTLVDRYSQMVFRTCMGFVHNREDAEDLTQEVFLRAFQSLAGFKGKSSFPTWIYRIAVNASLNFKRKHSGISLFERLESLFSGEKSAEKNPVFSLTDDPEKILIEREHSLWLQRALDSLPANQRTAIILSKYEDLSQKEISEIMNLSIGAVEALLQRAKKNLRERLSAGDKKKLI
ncbi:MAG: RNA polymerase sigma factor [Bacteroidales bacterium]|jgi:RNA polymerase sigma-70 factor (ECF subfamily)|nr:RNA polymerase sigma factor [Bacteroidales bacterium]